MRTKPFIKFANINETYFINLKTIFKKNIKGKKIQIKIYFKCLFTSIF